MTTPTQTPLPAHHVTFVSRGARSVPYWLRTARRDADWDTKERDLRINLAPEAV